VIDWLGTGHLGCQGSTQTRCHSSTTQPISVFGLQARSVAPAGGH
jgi:hypothetical protein